MKTFDVTVNIDVREHQDGNYYSAPLYNEAISGKGIAPKLVFTLLTWIFRILEP